MNASASTAASELALLPIKAVRAKRGISEATIYRMIQRGAFPKPYKVGTRSVWLTTELDTWIHGAGLAAKCGAKHGAKCCGMKKAAEISGFLLDLAE